MNPYVKHCEELAIKDGVHYSQLRVQFIGVLSKRVLLEREGIVALMKVSGKMSVKMNAN